MKALKTKLHFKKLTELAPLLLVSIVIIFAAISNSNNALSPLSGGQSRLISSCGSASNRVQTSINFGCSNTGNPIEDLLFAVIRFLSAGVGLVIILSVIIGGIQYIVSRGDPNATSKAVNRLVSAVIALILYVFAYAILSYIIPQGFFK